MLRVNLFLGHMTVAPDFSLNAAPALRITGRLDGDIGVPLCESGADGRSPTMTPDERNLLQRFLSDLGSTRGAAKDAEADGMIGGALQANPDAAYLLVQHAILADQALQAAQQRIQALEAQAPFAPAAPMVFGGQPAPQPGWNDAPPQAPPQSPLSPSGGLGGVMRTAGTMAAGVAGGEFLAQGLSNLFSPRDW